MRSRIEQIDRWCRSGDFTARDLAIYRTLYGTAMLLYYPNPRRLINLSVDSFQPPLGPMRLFSHLPSLQVLDVLAYATTACAALLVVGLWTRLASAGIAVMLIIGIGLSNSYGKIDHPYLMFIVPSVMLFSDWGRSRTRMDQNLPVSQWPMRLLALIIGLGFFAAGLAKVYGGWLNPHTHAVQGYVVGTYVINGQDGWLAPTFAGVTSGPFWEALDWLTVLLECGLVFAALSWLTFRIGIAAATLFHLGVMLMLNIAFAPNVIAYGAFVRWGRLLPVPRWRFRLSGPVAALVAAGLAVGAFQLRVHAMTPNIGPTVIFVGAAIGAGYLMWVALTARKRIASARRTSRVTVS